MQPPNSDTGQTTPGPGTKAPISFPLRLAAIDVGSNAIRLIAAEFSDPRHYSAIETHRMAVRLGHDAFRTGALTQAAIDAGIDALSFFRRRLDELGIDHYRAVATSAVRESRNSAEFVERARHEAGIHLETITGREEARLVWLAVRERVTLGRGKWVLVDLGGGSVEVSLIDETGILSTESHGMGSVRMLEDLAGADDASDRYGRLVEEYASRLHLPEIAARATPVGTIATGGNIEALGKLAGCEPGTDGLTVLPLSALQEVAARLAAATYDERIHRFGLREDRADVIVPAAAVYERVARLAGARQIVIPNAGVKEGILADLVDDLTAHGAHASRQLHGAFTGAVALGRRYRFDEEHATHVADLALTLFDHLSALHGLGEADRKILLAAALLHDIGQFVSYRKHHKHSWYLISHAELPEFSPREIQLVALVARYHRRAEPQADHEGYRDLSPDEQARVQRLASLLRVADALDRDHRQRVTRVRASVEGNEVALEITGNGDLLIEQWSFQGKAQMLKRVLGVTPRLMLANAEPRT